MAASSGLRSRIGRVFNTDDDEYDPTIPPGVIDIDEQEKIIEKLKQEDLERTQRACRLVSIVTLLPLPYFLVRFLLSPSWFEFWCITIIAGAYFTAPDTGVANKQWPLARKVGAYLNLAFAAGMAMKYWAMWWLAKTFGNSYPYYFRWVSLKRFDWSGQDHQVLVIPLVVAALSFVSRFLIAPTDFGGLMASTYELLGA